MPVPRVAVIGAGSSGIPAIKTFRQAGLDVVGYEASDKVGGNWVFNNPNGMSSSYKSLHINTSRERMEYADFPMPKSYPDFPHHTHIAAYFHDYCVHFGILVAIRFQTRVEHVARHDDGTWTVDVRDAAGRRTSEVFDAVVVANGHHWDPRWPEPAFPGADEFTGTQLHSHYFKDNAAWHDQRVLVLGMGNSAMDIAVEASWVAARTFLSARRGVHVLPKYVFGKPLDQVTTGAANRLPWRLRQKLNEATMRVAVGRYSRYGLPEPEHGLFQAHPTISDSILSRIAHGEIQPTPTIRAFVGGRTVELSDGSREDVDVVVYATGYKVTFPFFDEGFVSAPGNDLRLYKRVFHPSIAGLAFLGLVQPLGAIMPVAERQSEVVADYLRGRYALPPAAEMTRVVERDRDAVARRYVASPRHTMQVDYDVYMHELRKEQRRGQERARAAGYPLPVPTLAADQQPAAA